MKFITWYSSLTGKHCVITNHYFKLRVNISYYRNLSESHFYSTNFD